MDAIDQTLAIIVASSAPKGEEVTDRRGAKDLSRTDAVNISVELDRGSGGEGNEATPKGVGVTKEGVRNGVRRDFLRQKSYRKRA